MNKIGLIITCLFAWLGMAASTPDSVRRELQKTSNPEARSILYKEAALYWMNNQNPDSADHYTQLWVKEAENKGDEYLADALIDVSKIEVNIGNFPQAVQVNQKYLSRFKKTNSKKGIATAYYNLGRFELMQGNLNKSVQLLEQANKLSGEWPRLSILVSTDLGSAYTSQGNYTEALRILQSALDICDSAKFPHEHLGLLHALGYTYGAIGDGKTALSYCERVVAITKNTDPMGYANELTNIAALENDLNQTDKAERDARTALNIVKELSPDHAAEVMYTLAQILYDKKDYSGARDLYLQMEEIARTTHNPLIVTLAGFGRARVMYQDHQYDSSLKTIREALPLMEGNSSFRDMATAYELVFKNYEKLGDYKNAFESFGKYHSITDSISNDDKVKELAMLRSRLEFQKKEVIYEKEKRIRNIVIGSLSVIFCLAILLAVFIFKNRQKLNTQRQMELDAQLKQVEYNLELSKVQLEEFALNIQEKNKLVESLEQKMMLQPVPDDSLLEQLRQSTILTEEEWEKFRELFEQVHSGFLSRLKSKYPSMSKAEIRFLTLAKLGFSNKEMAGVLGVSPQSIRTNWYRVRKKLEILEEINIEDFVGTI